jgi:2-hydroxychromene-2-carboxylate isomerase
LGDLIWLAERRAARAALTRRPARPHASFFFDLVSPFTYLAAERVDRLFGGVRWQPALDEALATGRRSRDLGEEVMRMAAEERAIQLGMPLVWPDVWPAGGRSAMRVADLAVERGHGAAFVLAISRLAFCGGYDIDDPEILAEAAAVAGLGLDECLQAAGEQGRDGPLEEAALWLERRGADDLPALVVGRMLYAGEGRLAEAAAAAGGQRVQRARGVRTFGG